MGLFEWLFGKKAAGQEGSAIPPECATATATATAPPVAADGRTAPARPGNLVDNLLQRCKELPPHDPGGAATLLREMLQASSGLPANSERAQELNMALDSMARHYPDALQGLANGQNEIAVRERAIQLLAQRNDLRAIRPALDLARAPAAGQVAAVLQALLHRAAEQISTEDLTALSRLENQRTADFSAVRDLAGRELRHREDRTNPELRMQENLRRWRDQAARSWVESRRGEWNHQDWIDLLASLENSSYWPVAPDAIGQVLEGLKREYLDRRQG